MVKAAVKKTTPKASKGKQQPDALDKKKQSVKTKPAALTKKRAAVSNKKRASNKLEEGVDGEIEYEDLGKIDDWDWTEATGTDAFISDDAGGFLCLEEISDVEVEYEGDEVSGKVAKFKVMIPLLCVTTLHTFQSDKIFFFLLSKFIENQEG